MRGSAFFLGAAILFGAVQCSATPLLPRASAGAPVAIEVSGKGYTYHPVTAGNPLVVDVDGPGSLDLIARWRFEDSREPVDVRAEVLLDGTLAFTHLARAYPGTSTYVGSPGWVAATPSHLSIEVPPGHHEVALSLIEPAQGTLDVNPVFRAPAAPVWRVAWRGALAAAYDSNAFRYSDQDVDDFLDGKREDRFPIESVDELRVEPSARVALAREESGRRTELAASADVRIAAANGEKSFSRFGLSFLERHAGVAFLAAEYAAIPSYLVRDIWDEDARAYLPCEFTKNGVTLEAGSDRALPVDLEGRLSYEIYRYDPDFLEYDADVTTAGLTAIARPAKGLRVDLGYALRRSVARATDEDGESRATSDDSDTSYDEDQYTARGRLEAGRVMGMPAVVTVRGRLSNRLYQTDRAGTDDPYHAGRKDTIWIASAAMSLGFTEGGRVEAFVEGRGRTVESDFVPGIGDTKDWSGVRVGLRLTLEGERFLD